jgi:hypothetical protein
LHVFCLVTGNALTGIMAGKICADVVFYFLTIMNWSNETQKLFLNHTTNESDKHKILFCVLMKSPSLEKLGSQIRYQYKYLFHK